MLVNKVFGALDAVLMLLSVVVELDVTVKRGSFVAIDVGHLPPCGVTFKMLWPVFLFLFFLACCAGSCVGSFVGCCGGSTTVMLNLQLLGMSTLLSFLSFFDLPL